MRDKFISVVSHELRSPFNNFFLEIQARKMQLDKEPAQGPVVSAQLPREVKVTA